MATPAAPTFLAQDLELAAVLPLVLPGSDFTGKGPVLPYPQLRDVSVNGKLLLTRMLLPNTNVNAPSTHFPPQPTPYCGLWLLDPAKGAVQLLSEDIVDYPFTALLAPQGDRVVYRGWKGCSSAPAQAISLPESRGEASVWILNIGSGDKKTLYRPRAPRLRAWLADGGFLVERVWEGLDGQTLWVEGEDGSARRVPGLVAQLHRTANQTSYLPDPPLFPSPDGRLLAYGESERVNGPLPMTISVIDREGGVLMVPPWQGLYFQELGLRGWSPDSRKLLYGTGLVTNPLGETQPSALMVQDVGTGEHRLLLENYGGKGIGGPLAWSPDSRVILLYSTDHKTLYALNADGTGLTKVYSSEQPLWYPPLYWSRDGLYLFFPGASVGGVQRGGVWAAAVRKPGANGQQLQELAQRLQQGPWPIRLSLESDKPPPPTPTPTPTPVPTPGPKPCPGARDSIEGSPPLDATPRPPSLAMPFRAENLEIAAEVQLTRWSAGYHRGLADVTVNGKVLVPRPPRRVDANGQVRYLGDGYIILDPSRGEAQTVAQEENLFPYGHFAFFHPDGNKIVYEANDRIRGGRLWVLDLETLTSSKLENPPGGFLKGWIPGDRVLLVDGDCIGIVGLDGSRGRVRTPEYVWAVSPDGRHYLARPIHPSDHRVIVRSLESGESVGEPWQGTVFQELQDERFWSPDGRLLVYAVEKKPFDETGDLMVFDLETREHRLLLEKWHDQRHGRLSVPLAWSPDSKVLLLRSDLYKAIYALNSDGTGLTEVHPLTQGSDTWHHWSADGGYLIFQRFFNRDAGEGKAGIWASVVRKPGENDQDFQERVLRLEQGPWPIIFGP